MSLLTLKLHHSFALLYILFHSITHITLFTLFCVTNIQYMTLLACFTLSLLFLISVVLHGSHYYKPTFNVVFTLYFSMTSLTNPYLLKFTVIQIYIPYEKMAANLKNYFVCV